MWVFNGEKNKFPSALFETFKEADLWIRREKLPGTLTEYPVGKPVYDWAIEIGVFKIRKPHEALAEFKANFSSAAQEHLHFTEGKLAEEIQAS